MAVTKKQLLADPNSGARPLSRDEQAERARNAEAAAQWVPGDLTVRPPLPGPGQRPEGSGRHAPRRVAHPPALPPGPARART